MTEKKMNEKYNYLFCACALYIVQLLMRHQITGAIDLEFVANEKVNYEGRS
jgi:hypothetical protein